MEILKNRSSSFILSQEIENENIKYIWCSGYCSDFIESLKEAEKHRKKIHFKSPQKQFRASLVQVIRYSAEILVLGRTTVHLAVYLLDVFMDTYAITQNKLNVIALTCLLLASKIEERDINVPKLDKLCQISRFNSIFEFKKAEVRLLKFFEWYLLFPTAATFLEFYISNIVSKKDISKLINSKLQNFVNENDVIFEANVITFEILDLTLQDQSLVQDVPSITAAACLAVARKYMQLCKWNNEMFAMTGYEFSEIKKTYEKILELKRIKKNENRNKRMFRSGLLRSSDSETEFCENVCNTHTQKRRRMNWN